MSRNILLTVCVCLVSQTLRAAEPAKYAIKKERLAVPMRDGVKLSAEVWRPDVDGKFPALLLLRYWQTGQQEAEYFAARGYAVVMVDSRGRGKSEGEWYMYRNEPRDGFDVQEWLGSQAWCSGKIGTFGQSYNAFTQLMPAPLGSKHLTCLFPIEGQETNFGHVYNDGVMQLNMVFTAGLYTTGPTAVLPHKNVDDPFFRKLPLISVAEEFPKAVWIKDWFAHDQFDDYWKSYGIRDKYDKIKVPAYLCTGWYDNLVHEGFKVFKGLREHGGSKLAREQTRIRVGPTPHGGAWGQCELMNRWYDHWLKGVDNGIDKEPAVQVYVMGADRWRSGDKWPLPGVKFTSYFLTSHGKANSSNGDGAMAEHAGPSWNPPDKFIYDPEKPVMTMGGQMSTNPEVWGPQDRRKTQERDDVLVYTSPVFLGQDIEVTGPVELKLFASSSAVDTDFTATLTDVYPDGKAIHICEGVRGVRFRESVEHPTPIEPGKIYEYTISLWETSQLFKAGHRIRLEISSSNFPRYARNQNTGLPFGTSAEMKKAEQTIYHDGDHPSRLILPIIPAEKPR
jgi:putative CocE/NonD family hydrolase